MLLFNKIFSIAQVLRLLHIPHVIRTYLSLKNVHFKFYVPGYCSMKIQNYVLGKSQDYYTTMPHQENSQLKVSWMNSLTKKSYTFNSALITEVPYVLALLRTIIRTISVTCSRHLCVSYVYVASSLWGVHHPTLMCWLHLLLVVFTYRSNMLSAHSSFWLFNESMQAKGYCRGVSTQRNGNMLYITLNTFSIYNYPKLHKLVVFFSIFLLI